MYLTAVLKLKLFYGEYIFCFCYRCEIVTMFKFKCDKTVAAILQGLLKAETLFTVFACLYLNLIHL